MIAHSASRPSWPSALLMLRSNPDVGSVVRRCMAEGLVGGDGFAVDASLIKADANRQRGVHGSEGLSPEVSGRAVDEYMAVLDDAAFGAATEVTPKFISPADPAAPLDRRPWRAGLLRLLGQLPDRSGSRRHCRCGSCTTLEPLPRSNDQHARAPPHPALRPRAASGRCEEVGRVFVGSASHRLTECSIIRHDGTPVKTAPNDQERFGKQRTSFR